METTLLDILRACRRSRTRVRVWSALFRLRTALIAELADAADTSPERILDVMHGDGRRFRSDGSLVRLGIAVPKETPRGVAYALTERGAAAWEPVRDRLRSTGRAEP